MYGIIYCVKFINEYSHSHTRSFLSSIKKNYKLLCQINLPTDVIIHYQKNMLSKCRIP